MKLIFILLITYLAYSVLRSVAKKSRASGAAQYGHGAGQSVEHGRGSASGRDAKSANADAGKSVQTDPGEEMVLDPVCSSYVPLSVAVKKGSGVDIVYFCSKECMEKHGE